jgi:peroxiredoxin
MVSEIAAEKPGAPRKSYTLPLLAVGAVAPGVAGPGLDGQAVAWESLRGKRATFLFFGATTCPFSVGALAPLRELAAAFKAHGVAFVAVNRGEELETIKPVYAKAAAGLPVVWDKGGEQCTAYGVDAVPFFYLLDADAKVVMRRSFTPGAATAALNELLGMAVPAPRYAPSEAG